jgi:hypothetical protein
MSKDTIQTDDQDIWNRLHDELYERRTTMTEMSEQITKLTHERDEARRMYCHMAGQVMYRSYNKSTAEHVADNKNWDCYKKDETK